MAMDTHDFKIFPGLIIYPIYRDYFNYEYEHTFNSAVYIGLYLYQISYAEESWLGTPIGGPSEGPHHHDAQDRSSPR